MPKEQEVDEKDLPGFEEVGDPEIEKLGRKYKKQSKEWVDAQKPAFETEKKLVAAVLKNKTVLEAAQKHPKGQVKVGGILLTIPKASDPKVKVKILKEEED